MAEFIPTEAEKAAASYLDWSDEALGKFTKRVALKLEEMRDDAEGLRKVATASCAMTLVSSAWEANAGRLELSLEGHTIGEQETGDWIITVEKKPA